jgi:adenosine deaminase
MYPDFKTCIQVSAKKTTKIRLHCGLPGMEWPDHMNTNHDLTD